MSIYENTYQINTSNHLIKSFYQFTKFSFIGVFNTAIDLIVLNIAFMTFGFSEGSAFVITKSISFLCAAIFSYYANKYWTFEDKSFKNERLKFSQFILVSLIGMSINVFVSTIVLSNFKTPINNLLHLSILTNVAWINISALTGTAVGLIWNFTGYKFIIFKK